MKKIKNVLIVLFILIICFCLSAFGMYKYSNYKNNITMQKEKAVTAAQNLQKENTKSTEINKDIELASSSAKNSKYDDANKYLDDALKLDPNNSEAKNLKDSYSKIIEQQKQQANIQSQTQLQAQKQQNQVASTDNSNNGFLTYNQALELLKEQYPNYSFTPMEDQTIINNLIQQNGRMLKNTYFFYVHNIKCGDDEENCLAVNKVSRHIYSIYPKSESDYEVDLIK